MSLMTPQERVDLVPKGAFVKYKCDRCGKPIMSPLSYSGENGEDFCSRACRDSKSKPSQEKQMKEEKKSKPASSKDEAPKKKRRHDDEDEAPKPKKKAKPAEDEDDDEEEAPKPKKRAKAADEVEDEAPKKSKKKSKDDDEDSDRNPNNPYNRPSSVAYKAFELALKGTTVKAINGLLKEHGVAPARVWRELRSANFRGKKWRVIESEDGGKFQIKLRTKE